MKRVSLSLSDQTADHLTYLSERMRISRSSLVERLMAEPAADLVRLVQAIPANPTDEDVRRLRGQSWAVVEERVQNLRGMSNDLLS